MNRVGAAAILVHARAHVESRRRHIHRGDPPKLRGRLRSEGGHDHIAPALRRPALEPVNVVTIQLNLIETQRAGGDARGGQGRRPGTVRCHPVLLSLMIRGRMNRREQLRPCWRDRSSSQRASCRAQTTDLTALTIARGIRAAGQARDHAAAARQRLSGAHRQAQSGSQRVHHGDPRPRAPRSGAPAGSTANAAAADVRHSRSRTRICSKPEACAPRPARCCSRTTSRRPTPPSCSNSKDAGAVLVGKTNTHELGGGVTTINPFFGTTRNPVDRTRIPGGSSGGSAAAVAAHLCLAATGSDTGGSVRIPAAFCGCVGFKPTFGRISTRGLIAASPTFDHVGFLTRTVEDAQIMFRARRAVPAPSEQCLPVKQCLPVERPRRSARGISSTSLARPKLQAALTRRNR